MICTSVQMIHTLYEDGGEGSPSNPVKFKGQDYKQLKETLLNEGKIFEDETFPANLTSLGNVEDISPEQLSEVEWLRPHELNPDASFVVDGASRLDFTQGDVGNCWFLSSIGALTLHKPLLAQVVPLDQSFKVNYAGIFHFKFWRFGKWVDVVIDDLLPTLNKVPVSVSSRSEKEFWAPLLEKAYAKICGSYGDMIPGNPPEALKDFSGGVHMSYTMSKSPSDLWDVMNRAIQCKTMIGCATFSGEKGDEIFDQFGLVAGHAFAVTGVKQVESQGNKVNLVRIWNPWGEKEWNGDWSDKSELWKTVSDEDRDQCLKIRDEGEFWMKMQDYCTYYEGMDICCDCPNFVDGDAACQWNCSVKEGRWEAGKSAGGSDRSTEEFWTNPQYRLTVKGENTEDKNVLLSLMQKPDEEYRSKVIYHHIGFLIYKVPSEVNKIKGKMVNRTTKRRRLSSLCQYEEPEKVSLFHESREVIEFYSLQPGEYIIVPCTFDSNKTSDFIITIYSKAEVQETADFFIGVLTLDKLLMGQVLPLDQNFKDIYPGTFHSRMWKSTLAPLLEKTYAKYMRCTLK